MQGLAGHWIGFIISLMINSDKYFDITEDITIFSMFIWHYNSFESPSMRQTIIFGCALIWCIRLCAFVGYRVLVRGSDWRFDKLIKAHAYGFFAWTSGGTWCWANMFCLWQLADSSNKEEYAALGLIDMIGLLLFVIGFSIEIIADI